MGAKLRFAFPPVSPARGARRSHREAELRCQVRSQVKLGNEEGRASRACPGGDPGGAFRALGAGGIAAFALEINGERGGARTRDHRIKSPMLYRLSYPSTAEKTVAAHAPLCVDSTVLAGGLSKRGAVQREDAALAGAFGGQERASHRQESAKFTGMDNVVGRGGAFLWSAAATTPLWLSRKELSGGAWQDSSPWKAVSPLRSATALHRTAGPA